MVELETCVKELEHIERSLKVIEGRIERLEWNKAGKKREVVVLLKSLRFPSLDETPIIATIIDSLADNPEVRRVEVYEYETIKGEMGRSERAAAVLESAFKRGSGIIAITPSLLGISLVSRLAEKVAEELEKGAVANINVKFENVLYLPSPNVIGSIELLAKKNSKSSYERVTWIKEVALKRGLKVSNVLYMEDNKSIISYMISKGSKGIYESVPVTKVSKVVLAFSRCASLKGLDELRRTEEASHTIYAIDVSEEVIEDMLKRLDELLSKTWNPLDHPRIAPYVREGVRELMEDLGRKFLAMVG